MASASILTKMSVEEYLRTPFSPDVDGVIEERNCASGITRDCFASR